MRREFYLLWAKKLSLKDAQALRLKIASNQDLRKAYDHAVGDFEKGKISLVEKYGIIKLIGAGLILSAAGVYLSIWFFELFILHFSTTTDHIFKVLWVFLSGDLGTLFIYALTLWSAVSFVKRQFRLGMAAIFSAIGILLVRVGVYSYLHPQEKISIFSKPSSPIEKIKLGELVDHSKLLSENASPEAPPLEKNEETPSAKSTSDEPHFTMKQESEAGSEGRYFLFRKLLLKGTTISPEAVPLDQLAAHFTPLLIENNSRPYAISIEGAPSIDDPQKILLKVSLRANELSAALSSNFVAIVNTATSMSAKDRLPLVKKTLQKLREQMIEGDYLSVFSFGGVTSFEIFSSENGEKSELIHKIDELNVSGATEDWLPFEKAITELQKHLSSQRMSRLILYTDETFSAETFLFKKLLETIQLKKHTGLSLTVVGVGDALIAQRELRALAVAGDGFYFPLQSLDEFSKALSDATFVRPVADALKDVSVTMALQGKQATLIEAQVMRSGEQMTKIIEVLAKDINDTDGIGSIEIAFTDNSTGKLSHEHFAIEKKQLSPDLQNASLDYQLASIATSFGKVVTASKSERAAKLQFLKERLSNCEPFKDKVLCEELLSLINSQVSS